MFVSDFAFDEDDDLEGLYEDGHWEWDEINEQLIFVSDLSIPEEIFIVAPTKIVGPIEFKDDIDLMEQQRFRKRFQRKTAEKDIVTLQDIKDVVLFTAPITVLTVSVINLLHQPITERFLRSLILFCQYYLQVTDIMSKRTLDLEYKVRTPNSLLTEKEYRENVEDLRLLVAKEYSCMILGGAEYRKYHHMGPSKKLKSLSKKEAVTFETLIRMSIQIVWLALGRKSFNQIELEIHRMFKSPIFNVAEHKLKTNFEAKMSPEERFVLIGHCMHHEKKLNTRSPVMNEVACHRKIDYRLLGIGSIKYPNLNARLRFLENILVAPEANFQKLGFTLGIIGLPREQFDTMLHEIKLPSASTASSSASFRSSMGRIASRASRASTAMRKSGTSPIKLYNDIILPDKVDDTEILPDEFPEEFIKHGVCSKIQQRRWLGRMSSIAGKRFSVKMSRSKMKAKSKHS